MGEGETSYQPDHILSAPAWKKDIKEVLGAEIIDLPPDSSFEKVGKHDYNVFEITTDQGPLFLGIYNSIDPNEPFKVTLYSLPEEDNPESGLHYRSEAVGEIRVSRQRGEVTITGRSEVWHTKDEPIEEIIINKFGKVLGYTKDNNEMSII